MPSYREQPPQAEAHVDLNAIRANVATLRAGTSADVMAVLKADAYGHGLLPTARAALAGGARWLGVCTTAEALALRAGGITAPVLAWLLTPGQPYADLLAADIQVSVATTDQLAEVVAAAESTGRTGQVHLKVDTGMSRGGAAKDDWPRLVEAAAKFAASSVIENVGVWSHLAIADVPADPSNARQIEAFTDAIEVAAAAGVRPRIRHLANSAATLALPEAHFDLVRPGISVYGFSPIAGPAGESTTAAYGLRPAMTVRGRVLLTKRVPPGQGVSYGHLYTTDRETTLAVVPLGYADGVPRAGTNKLPVLLGGRRRTIAGRVCMDQFVLDVGDDLVRSGDEAVLFGPGDGGEPTADDWAHLLDTISYEIVTRIGGRTVRTYSGDNA